MDAGESAGEVYGDAVEAARLAFAQLGRGLFTPPAA